MTSCFLQNFNISHFNQNRACQNVESKVTILVLKAQVLNTGFNSTYFVLAD